VATQKVSISSSFMTIANKPLYLGTGGGARWRSWLRHYATNRQVEGSILDGVTGIFQSHNTSGRTMALESTQPLTEMSTRLFPGGKGGRCVRLTTLPPSCAVVMKSGNLNFLEPSGPLQAHKGTAFTLYLCIIDDNTQLPIVPILWL
jgi:hypothetical protein